jgi:hypothetical protein
MSKNLLGKGSSEGRNYYRRSNVLENWKEIVTGHVILKKMFVAFKTSSFRAIGAESLEILTQLFIKGVTQKSTDSKNENTMFWGWV